MDILRFSGYSGYTQTTSQSKQNLSRGFIMMLYLSNQLSSQPWSELLVPPKQPIGNDHARSCHNYCMYAIYSLQLRCHCISINPQPHSLSNFDGRITGRKNIAIILILLAIPLYPQELNHLSSDPSWSAGSSGHQSCSRILSNITQSKQEKKL